MSRKPKQVMILVSITGVKGEKPKNTPMLFPLPVSALPFIFKIIKSRSGHLKFVRNGHWVKPGYLLIGLNLKPVKSPGHVIPAPHGECPCQF